MERKLRILSFKLNRRKPAQSRKRSAIKSESGKAPIEKGYYLQSAYIQKEWQSCTCDILDSCRYSPLLKVFDLDESLLFETDLPETIDLNYLGEIQLSSKKVTIKPRKSSYTKAIEPISM